MSGISVDVAVGCFVISVIFQAVVSRAAWRRVAGACRPRFDVAVARELLRFGTVNVVTTLPYALNAHFDVILLAVLVPPAELGHYVVAVTLATLGVPVALAFGAVALPRLASMVDGTAQVASRRIARRTVAGSLLVGAAVTTTVAALAAEVVPFLFGAAFVDSVQLAWLMAPGAALLGCNRAMGDVLRGMNRQVRVGQCEGAGAVVTGVLLLLLVPLIGVAGAAIASATAYTV
nr:oligosaccharide flippase family protein [Micromonospora sp. DSM 115978]